jgi:hypothetical protein
VQPRLPYEPERRSPKEKCMRGRGCVSIVALLLASIVPIGGWSQEIVIPKGDEALYGTWANEKNLVDVLHGQKVIVSADGMKVFSKVSDPDPRMIVTWEITGKWKDSDGNVWYKTLGTSTGGVYQGAKWQSLEKISKSGTVWERATILLETGSFNPAFYPKTIDKKGVYYRVLYRTGK